MLISCTSQYGDIAPPRSRKHPYPFLPPRSNETTLLPDSRSEGRSPADRRIQALSREDLAGDYPQHQRLRHRGHGNLSARHAHVYDHGGERVFLVRSQEQGRPTQPASTGVGDTHEHISEIAAPSQARRKMAADGTSV